MTTTTTPTPVVEPTTVDHLDFDPACHLFTRPQGGQPRVPCPDPAIWYVVLRHHCVPDEPLHLFLCERHHKRLVTRHPWGCPTCGGVFVPYPNVIRTERIR